MFIEDLSEKLYFAEFAARGFKNLSVGWLGDHVPSKGETSPGILAALRRATDQNYIEDYFLGEHICEICGEFSSHGHFYVQHRDINYLLPVMVEHYIVAHGYMLPGEVVEALAAMG